MSFMVGWVHCKCFFWAILSFYLADLKVLYMKFHHQSQHNSMKIVGLCSNMVKNLGQIHWKSTDPTINDEWHIEHSVPTIQVPYGLAGFMVSTGFGQPRFISLYGNLFMSFISHSFHCNTHIYFHSTVQTKHQPNKYWTSLKELYCQRC